MAWCLRAFDGEGTAEDNIIGGWCLAREDDDWWHQYYLPPAAFTAEDAAVGTWTSVPWGVEQCSTSDSDWDFTVHSFATSESWDSDTEKPIRMSPEYKVIVSVTHDLTTWSHVGSAMDLLGAQALTVTAAAVLATMYAI